MQRQVEISLPMPDEATLRTRLAQLADRHGPATWRGDTEDRFPAEALHELAEAGLLTAPLPRDLGGLGWGTEPEGGAALAWALRRIGAASLPLGRVFEGHVNAVRLLHRLAAPPLLAEAAAALHAGGLIGLWVTAFGDPVRAEAVADGLRLRGQLDVCSGAGIASHAVIALRDASDVEQLAFVDAAPAVRVPGSSLDMHGMRAAATAAMRFETVVPARAVFAGPGDYMREPDFSAGAWRTSAVTVGGLEALVALAAQELASRGRHSDPHQLARLGRMVLARDTARLWLDRIAGMAEAADPDPGETSATANLARLAIERACLEVLELVTRSLGLSAMRRGNPVERLSRDLATYLRQPAGDEVLAVAAAWHVDRLVAGNVDRLVAGNVDRLVEA